jgi:hypothetical protein
MEDYVFDNILQEVTDRKDDAGETLTNVTAATPELVSVSFTVDYKNGNRKPYKCLDDLFHGDTAGAIAVHLVTTVLSSGIRTIRKVAAINPATSKLDYIKANGAFGSDIARA